MRTRHLPILLIVIGLLAAACGSEENGGSESEDGMNLTEEGGPEAFATPFAGADAYPVFVSSEIVVGENRFLIGVLDSNDAPLGSPDLSVDVTFYDFDESTDEPAFTESTDFVWIVEQQGRGLYVSHPTFDHAGLWGAEVSIQGQGIDEALKGSFEVAEESTTPAIGAKVPASDTPTAADVDNLSEISTDDDPNPDFYELSVAQAVKRSVPFVVVFATPKFCTSAVCGPTLDDVEKVAADFPEITFIHSEIYKGLDPSNPAVPAVTEWGLPSEPWVFVVDGRGKLVAKFEGSAPPEELRPVLENLN